MLPGEGRLGAVLVDGGRAHRDGRAVLTGQRAQAAVGRGHLRPGGGGELGALEREDEARRDAVARGEPAQPGGLAPDDLAAPGARLAEPQHGPHRGGRSASGAEARRATEASTWRAAEEAAGHGR